MLNEDEGSLILRILQTQAQNPNKYDWYLKIFLDFEQFKDLVYSYDQELDQKNRVLSAIFSPQT